MLFHDGVSFQADGRTALFMAAESARQERVKLLLDRGANANLTTVRAASLSVLVIPNCNGVR